MAAPDKATGWPWLFLLGPLLLTGVAIPSLGAARTTFHSCEKETSSSHALPEKLCAAHQVNCRELEAAWPLQDGNAAKLSKLAAPGAVFMTDEYISIFFSQSISMSLC